MPGAVEAIKSRRFLLSFLLCFAAALAVLCYAARIAWVDEDANITFRVVENALNGYGLRWNVDERVQAYTHPLWLLLLVPATAALRPFFPAQEPGEPHFQAIYYAHLTLSMTCLAVMLGLLLWRFRHRPGLFLGFVILPFAACDFFMDYTVSGLENILAFLLITLLADAFFKPDSPRIWFRRSLYCALLILTRMDQLLLFVPVFATTLLLSPRAFPWRPLLLGGLPLAAWLAFSLAYYGFIMPNTYYAKLPPNFSFSTYLPHGLLYLQDFARATPTGALVYMLAGAWAGLFLARWRSQLVPLCLFAGAALHLCYVIAVGGDYMTGRLFTFSYCLVVLAMAYSAPAMEMPIRRASLMALLVSLAFSQPWKSAQIENFTETPYIYNERLYRSYSCFFCESGYSPREHFWAGIGTSLRKEKANHPNVKYVTSMGSIGLIGLFAGQEVMIIDQGRLGDAFLARLPVNWEFRPGHFYTDEPPGYYNARLSGDYQQMQPDLAEYYRNLWEIIGGPLWSWQRWKNIIAFNLGLVKPPKVHYPPPPPDEVPEGGYIRLKQEE